MKTLPTPITVDLARAFARRLWEEIGADMGDVVAMNRAETRKGICHTHDFCDANQVMLDAMDEVIPGFSLEDDNGRISVIDTAWTLASKADFGIDASGDFNPERITEQQ